MTLRKARDLMVPIDQYPIVDSSATVLDAVIRLDKSRRSLEPGRQPYQAVLVADKEGKIVGKLGQLALLRSLEPRSLVVDDQNTLKKAGVSNSIMEAALSHYRVLQQELSEMCLGAAAMPVRSVMLPFREHVDVEAPVREVIHQMLVWQTLSVLVTQEDRPVGLIRLSDLCDEVMKQMRQTASCGDNED
ncbi:MAG: CBS domain-containing protein [Candidatus Zixiibacteriota bacterium]|nr:MAG: CBS domain-containing protein [candidate division Zixibacteria bacterium]